MDWETFFALLLGAALAILSGTAQEQIKNRRRLQATARVLLHEIGRLFRYFDRRDLDDSEVRQRLDTAVTDYKDALFSVDAITFSEHYPLYLQLVDAVESQNTFLKEAPLILEVRPKLAQLLDLDLSSFEDGNAWNSPFRG
jgi:hypothetical protein